ncbi:hypothetical protein V8G54_030899 [Vigna mungo]|uniref:Uncharacterized protein n=1 Tax=Vigna mungo TaxID=3915 RepID=A0AAQ3RKI8_VIGMU
MASSSSSRRKRKVSRISRNVNPTGRISYEDIRGKLLSLRKIKTVVSHRYLKLVRVFYSNIKMNDETFCSRVKGVDIKVWNRIVVFQPIKKEGFLFEKWIGHQQVYPISESWSANKIDLTKTEEDDCFLRFYACFATKLTEVKIGNKDEDHRLKKSEKIREKKSLGTTQWRRHQFWAPGGSPLPPGGFATRGKPPGGGAFQGPRRAAKCDVGRWSAALGPIFLLRFSPINSPRKAARPTLHSLERIFHYFHLGSP